MNVVRSSCASLAMFIVSGSHGVVRRGLIGTALLAACCRKRHVHALEGTRNDSRQASMKILVTGGAGFIGSHVVETYLKSGHEVVVVDNLRSGKAAYVPDGVRLHVVDVAASEVGAVMALERPDLVNHHAAQTSVTVSAREPELDARINCCGLLNVLRSCVEQRVSRFIFVSSGGAIYGDVEQLPTAEDVAPRPQSPYGMHKLVGELYLEFYRREHGLRYTVLRYGQRVRPPPGPAWRSRSSGDIHGPAASGKAADHIRVSRPAQRDDP